MKVKIIKKRARTIFTKTKISGLNYTVNQYVGCIHACLYCYAKYMCKWKQYGKWGTWVEVKINAPDLIRGKFVKGEVLMSTVSDPYQPIERELKITRKVLENMNKKIKLSILTKSDLVTRDIDLFRKFSNVHVGLTLNDFDKSVKKKIEPNTPSHERRIDALKELKENKIKTYVFISPIIPDLVDVEKIIAETRDIAEYYIFETLNLNLSGKDFIEYLLNSYPNSYTKLTNKEKFERLIKDLKHAIEKTSINAELIVHKNDELRPYLF